MVEFVCNQHCLNVEIKQLDIWAAATSSGCKSDVWHFDVVKVFDDDDDDDELFLWYGWGTKGV